MMTDRALVEARAAQWVMRRREPDWHAGDEAALADWLDRSVMHRAAYWRLSHGDALMDGLAEHRTIAERRRPRRDGRWRRRSHLGGAVAVAASAAAAILVFLPAPKAAREPVWTRYETMVGQVGHVTLPDGTRVDLDSATTIRIRQDSASRSLWVDKGQVYVDVSKDKRPFVTYTGQASITDIGTQFSVVRGAGHTSVAVVEGEVRLESRLYPRRGASTVSAGEVARTDGRTTLLTMADTRQLLDALAWRDGSVIFRNTRLDEAAAQFNRYNRRKLKVADEVADLRIGGAFRLGNVVGFSRLLASAYQLKVDSDEEQITISPG